MSFKPGDRVLWRMVKRHQVIWMQGYVVKLTEHRVLVRLTQLPHGKVKAARPERLKRIK